MVLMPWTKSLSDAVMFELAVSVTPDGGVKATSLVSVESGCKAPRWAAIVYVMLDPEARFTVSSMLPLPLAVKPLAPVVPTAVYVSLVMPAFGRLFDSSEFDVAYALAASAPIAGCAGWWLLRASTGSANRPPSG